MSLYEASVVPFTRMLKNLDKWFDKTEAYAATKKFDPSVLLVARLAPDQLAFTKQVQIACDSAKLGIQRVTGKQSPTFSDDESSFAELRQRIAGTLAYLATITESDFDGADKRKVVVPQLPGKFAYGKDYLFEHTIPTFYFHVMTTYSLLRHNGVDLGKADYLGAKTLHDG